MGGPIDETAFEYDIEVGDDPVPVLDGIPPLPPRARKRLEPYLDVRRARLGGATSDGATLLVLTRLGEATHAHRVRTPGGDRQQITFGANPIQQVAFVPSKPSEILFRSDVGGTEDFQMFHLHLDTRATTLLTDGRSRWGAFRWAPTKDRIAFTGTERNGRDMDLYVSNGATPARRRVAELSGHWGVLGWSRDATRVAVQQWKSVHESAVFIADATTGNLEAVHAPAPGTSTRAVIFTENPDVLYVTSNRGEDFVSPWSVDLRTKVWKRLGTRVAWDVEEIAVTGDARTVAFTTNEDGFSVVRVWQAGSGKHRVAKGIPRGVISDMRFIGAKKTLAFTMTTPTAPADVFTYDVDLEKLVRWTESEVGGLPRNRFVGVSIERLPSFDGLEIPALYYRPRGPGPFPVVLWIHGGPEDQSRPAFEPLIQYLVSERKIAVVAPNLRGSDGYGQRYLSLDDRTRRHDVIRDVGAVLDWIGRRGELDEQRVGIHGASYGGYVVLASLVEYGKRLAAGSNVVGISNFVSFLENTRDYRRDLRRVEYGDESDPETRAYLESISPLARADRIESPLLIAHGANDPRVPVEEAEEMVRAVRAGGSEVWYFLAQGEGHSFRRRRTRDAFYAVLASFYGRYLSGDAVPASDSGPGDTVSEGDAGASVADAGRVQPSESD